MKKACNVIVLIILALTFLTSCSGGGKKNHVETIRENGYLKVGVKSDVYGFGYIDPKTGDYAGLEVEIARLLAKEILGDSGKVEFTTVSTSTRKPAIDNGNVDLVLATFTITDERKETLCFSDPYYTDSIGLLVRQDSGYVTLSDLSGKPIGVLRNATTQAAIINEVEITGIQAPEFKEYSSFPDLKAALMGSEIEAFSVDKSILRGYLDDSTMILETEFGQQPYGIATKLDDTEFSEYINTLVNKWTEDGTIAAICSKYGI